MLLGLEVIGLNFGAMAIGKNVQCNADFTKVKERLRFEFFGFGYLEPLG